MVRLRDDELEWQELDGEVVVLDLRSSKYFVVNGSGTTLWHLLRDDLTTEQLIAGLCRAYDVPRETATEHVGTFVRDLRDRGLIDP